MLIARFYLIDAHLSSPSSLWIIVLETVAFCLIGWISVSPKCPRSNPRPFEYVTLHSKRKFSDVAQLRTLRWDIYLGLTEQAWHAHKRLWKERERGDWSDGATPSSEDGGQEHRQLPEVWKLSFLMNLWRNKALQTDFRYFLIFNPLKLPCPSSPRN